MRKLNYLAVCVAIVLPLLAACSGAKKPAAELPPQQQASPGDEAVDTAKALPPPDLKSVEAAVKRVFKDAALIDTTHSPMFVAGDFNGDQSTDLAVVIKPAPDKLAQMNEEFPGWILRSPLGGAESKAPRLSVSATDVMLAVIHGYGAEGWRDPQSTQTYLLKDVAGSGMQARSTREVRLANAGKELPQLHGDVIAEVVQGKQGFLYLSRSSYGWYDPETFTGEPDPRRGHGGAGRRTND